ncbi:glycoside hydrolase family 11 protein [Alteromonas sp. SM 2104]|nr:glycoside hydrolase family 11 protein [Alteromonas oceanisediminis]
MCCVLILAFEANASTYALCDRDVEKVLEVTFKAYTHCSTSDSLIEMNHATGNVGSFFFTHWKDGGSTSLQLAPTGHFNVTWEGGGYNYVGGPGWHEGQINRNINYSMNSDSGANFITLYGWGFDVDQPTSDPSHLVEYYVLQRWTNDYVPSDNGEEGIVLTSNGVEYRTFRTLRENKPSINGPSTFYQYWSMPAQQQPLGVTHTIVFADHVKAWNDSGWMLPNLNNVDASDDPTYQVLAVEVFNPKEGGSASGRVWESSEK